MALRAPWTRHPPTSAVPREELFDEAFLAKLELLHVLSRRMFAGQQRAERKTRKRGSGLEFADHREYSPGDDIRYLDWTAWARLRHRLIRVFEEDEDLPVRIVVDVSDSMTTRGGLKLRYARQVAAALAYVGLANLDRVGVACINAKVHDSLPAVRGKGRIFKVFEFLRQDRPRGPTSLTQSLGRIARETRRPGVTIVLSDFYDMAAFEGLNQLRFRKHEAVAIQLIDPVEADPRAAGLRGDIRVVDCEGDQATDVIMTPAILANFAAAHERFCHALEHQCRSRNIDYVRASITTPFDELVLGLFRARGLLL